jgi:hypothetical protein
MSDDHSLHQVAKKYRAAGYDVTVNPGRGEVPSFAKDFRPDIIAKKGDQRVIIQVKRDLSEMSEDKSLPRLAKITDGQPGWRLDLVILEQESPIEQIASHAAERSAEGIEELLQHAERSAQGNDILSAFIVAWAGLEAAMRYRTRLAGLATAKPLGAIVLNRTLFSSGFLSSQELRRLDMAYNSRNGIVHGFTVPKVGRTDVNFLVSLARRLLKGDGESEVSES